MFIMAIALKHTWNLPRCYEGKVDQKICLFEIQLKNGTSFNMYIRKWIQNILKYKYKIISHYI